MKGLRGLTYIKYQEPKLNEFRKNKPGMKVLIEVVVNTDEGPISFRSRRYEVINQEDSKRAINQMAQDIEHQIEK